MATLSITRDFIKKGYFDTLSHISLDDSDENKPISFFHSQKRYINFDGKVIKTLFIFCISPEIQSEKQIQKAF